MKRLICFILVLCLFCGAGAAFALELSLPDGGFDDLSGRLSSLLDELELRDKLDELDLETLMADIRELAKQSDKLSDEELNEAIRALAEKHGLTPDDEQIAKIVKLCRSLEKAPELKDKAADAKEKAVGLWQHVRVFSHKAAAFFQKLGKWLEKI